MRVLVTRPLEDGEQTARELEARGHQALVAPLLTVAFLDGAELTLDDVQAILEETLGDPGHRLRLHHRQPGRRLEARRKERRIFRHEATELRLRRGLVRLNRRGR